MKLLLLTVSAGEGHNAMCRAVSEAIGSEYPQAELLQLDLYKSGEQTRAQKKAAWMVNDGYFLLAKYAMCPMNRQYERLKTKDMKKGAKRLRKNFVLPAKALVEDALRTFRPDAVFCAHIYAGILMGDLRREGNEAARAAWVAAIFSDYDVPPYAELLTGLDCIFTLTDENDAILRQKGFDLAKRRVVGFPVLAKFSKPSEQAEARRAIGVREQKNTLLILSGSTGFGNMAKTIRRFNKCRSDFQVLCVCARNEKLKAKLEREKERGKFKKDLYVFGFVNNVEVLMSASDVLYGKMGGASVTEAFNKFLPVLASKKLPLQEYDNMVFLREHGACEHIRRERDLPRVLDGLFDGGDALERMRRSIAALRRPDAAKDIARLLCENRSAPPQKNTAETE